VASTSLVQRKGLKRRPFLCTPSRLETQELCRARQGIIINTGGAKCEYRGGAKSSCQTHRYAIRPIYVEDMARLIADAVDQPGNEVVNAVGPDTFAFEELVKLIAEKVGRSVRLIHLPMALAYVSTFVTGWFVGDVVLTWEEYQGLMGNLLAPEGPSAGQTRLSEWLAENHVGVGRQYASEVARHYAKSPDNLS